MNQLQKLQAHHYEAMALRLTGFTYAEIAEKIGKDQGTVSNWFICDDSFKEEFSTLKDETIDKTRESIICAAGIAAKRVIELITSTDEAVCLRAAKDILDRAGLKPTEKQESLIKADVKAMKLEDYLLGLGD